MRVVRDSVVFIECNVYYGKTLSENAAMTSALNESDPSLSLGHHHSNELLVVDVTVSVDVGLSDHLVDLLVGQLLSQVCHDVAQLGGRDETVAVTIEDLEGLNQLLLSVRILHLAGHEREELREVDGAVAVSINLVDHVLELGLGGVLSE